MLYLIVRFNFILGLSVALLHESKVLHRSLRGAIFRFISGVLGVIHRGFANIEVLDLRDACSPKTSLLLREVARNMGAGLVPSEAAEGCREQVAAFERAYREVSYLGGACHMVGLDLTVGYASGDNGEYHRDQWPRVECATKEIRRQQNEERYSRGQNGYEDGQRAAITAPGAVDQNTSPVSSRGGDQPGEGEEEEHIRYGDAAHSDPDAGENTPEDLICLHNASPRSSWQPGVVGAFYPDVGGHHALGANGPPARGA
jgi:hypothetical protein